MNSLVNVLFDIEKDIKNTLISSKSSFKCQKNRKIEKLEELGYNDIYLNQLILELSNWIVDDALIYLDKN